VGGAFQMCPPNASRLTRAAKRLLILKTSTNTIMTTVDTPAPRRGAGCSRLLGRTPSDKTNGIYNFLDNSVYAVTINGITGTIVLMETLAIGLWADVSPRNLIPSISFAVFDMRNGFPPTL
jgi:hypothetical protein